MTGEVKRTLEETKRMGNGTLVCRHTWCVETHRARHGAGRACADHHSSDRPCCTWQAHAIADREHWAGGDRPSNTFRQAAPGHPPNLTCHRHARIGRRVASPCRGGRGAHLCRGGRDSRRGAHLCRAGRDHPRAATAQEYVAWGMDRIIPGIRCILRGHKTHQIWGFNGKSLAHEARGSTKALCACHSRVNSYEN